MVETTFFHLLDITLINLYIIGTESKPGYCKVTLTRAIHSTPKLL